MSSEEYTTIMEKEYEEACSLENRYAFLNANLFPMLSKEEQGILIDM